MQPAAISGQRPPSRRGWWLGPVARVPHPSLIWPGLLYLLLRVPSWFEPHWYTDEAGYATTAWQTMHGGVLYLTAWNNKPPVLFWIYDLALWAFGPSEFGLHLLSTLAGLATIGAIWQLTRWRLGPNRAAIALVVAAVLLGTPVLNGDLALPENFLIAPAAWAMVLVLGALSSSSNQRRLGLGAGAGVLFAIACLIQQTAAADALAAVLVLVMLPDRRGWRPALALVGAGVVVGAAVLGPYVAAAGFHNVYFYLVSSYAGYTQSSLPISFSTLAPRLAAMILVVVGAYLVRRRDPQVELPWIWLATLLVVYVLPDRPYIHFLLPVAVPFCILVAGAKLPRRLPQAAGIRAAAARIPITASVAIGTVLWVVLLWAGFWGGSLFSIKLTGEYYPVFVGHLTGALSSTQYVDVYDYRAIAEQQADSWVRQHGLAGSTAVVWSPDAWAYLLGDLRPVLPAPPIYMDDLWLGTTAKLYRRLEQTRPVVVIVTSDSYTEYGPIDSFLPHSYREVQKYADGQLWILDGTKLPAKYSGEAAGGPDLSHQLGLAAQ